MARSAGGSLALASMGVPKVGFDGEEMELERFPEVMPAAAAMRTSNPIREIVEKLDVKRQAPHDKEVIPLSIGDPTSFGNLQPSKVVAEAVAEAALSGRANGYAPSTGILEARVAVAKHSASQTKGVHLTEKDVILTSGCSHALQMCFTALVDPEKKQNVLLPRPGFSLYRTICEHLGIEVREYDLLPNKNWEIDLVSLDSLIDENTAAVLVNNPSNPCGSVFSYEHKVALLRLCEKRQVTIVADEIYHGFVFGGKKSSLLAASGARVPILSVGGLSKRYLVPGWRLGWIVLYDVDSALVHVREALERLATLIVGPNTIVQAALPRILAEVDDSWVAGVVDKLEENAFVVYQRLRRVPGLKVQKPQGAMFMMVNVQSVELDDVKFAQGLLTSQGVVVLPGKIFGAPGFVRVTFSAPKSVLTEACDRIAAYCAARTNS